MLAKEISLLSTRAAEAVKIKSEAVIPKMCESRISQAIDSLLAEDCVINVKNMSAKIANRMARERIDQWMQSHIVGSSTFMKNLESELDRGFKNDEIKNHKELSRIIDLLRVYIKIN